MKERGCNTDARLEWKARDENCRRMSFLALEKGKGREGGSEEV
jgi:hypothetical protein